MKAEQIDMSPDAVTNRLKLMGQLWELSVNLMQAREISETALLSEKSPGKDWNSAKEEKAWQHLPTLSQIQE